MSEPCAFPRPLAVYLASEVISYCKAKRDARMRKSHHDLAAFVAETLEGMAAEGVALNTMAQYLLKEANQSLPINYRKNWRLAELPLKQALAQSWVGFKEQMERET